MHKIFVKFDTKQIIMIKNTIYLKLMNLFKLIKSDFLIFLESNKFIQRILY